MIFMKLNYLKSGLFLIFAILGIFTLAESYADTRAIELSTELKKVELIEGTDFEADGEFAREKNIPVLIMFSMAHCGFCREVEEDFLKPMLRNSEYSGKVLIRKVKLDERDGLRNFAGKVSNSEELSNTYNISLVPTLIFVDSEGKQLAPGIIGLANPHYYGEDIDKAINTSLLQLRTLVRH